MIAPWERERARAWPGLRPGPTPPTGLSLSTTFEACNDGYGLRPSSPRGGASTRCMTGSTGVTSCGRRGCGCSPIGERPGSNRGAPWHQVEECGAEQMLQDLHDALQAGRYQPLAGEATGIPRARRRRAAAGHPRRFATAWRSRRRSFVLEPNSFEADFLHRLVRLSAQAGAARLGRFEVVRRSFVEGRVRGPPNWTSAPPSTRSTVTGCSSSSQSGRPHRRVLKLDPDVARGGGDGGRTLLSQTVSGTPQGRGHRPPSRPTSVSTGSTRSGLRAGHGTLVRYAERCGDPVHGTQAGARGRPSDWRRASPRRPRAGGPIRTRRGSFDLRRRSRGLRLPRLPLPCPGSRVELLERGIRRYYLRRWPSSRSMVWVPGEGRGC